tara:strand:+ start:219715 stop:220314 length:600 start_codon:yes stop_codon:yes gene_type:complete
MKIAITAIAAIAGAATASPYFTGANGYESVGSAPAGALSTITVDLSGVETWDAYASALNSVMNINIGAGSHVVGIGWDVNQTSFGASWLSEMSVAFENSAQDTGVFLTTSGTGAPGTSESNSSGGILDLTILATPLDFFVDGDGLLRLEFFEGFDDVTGAADGIFNSGSSVQVQYIAVPAPGALAMLGLGGIVAGRRRR